jgi:hypothetical protein
MDMAYEPAIGIERLGAVKEIAEAASVGVAQSRQNRSFGSSTANV